MAFYAGKGVHSCHGDNLDSYLAGFIHVPRDGAK
jgi:hypothetical protein